MAEIQQTPEKKKRRYTKPRAESQSGMHRGMAAPDKMELMFTVVNREKTDFFIDALQAFEVNIQMILSASGTASTQMIQLLGLSNTEKSVIISAIRRDKVAAAMAMLDEKFKTVRGAKGIAYTVPMSSIIGVLIYQFISNKNSTNLQGD